MTSVRLRHRGVLEVLDIRDRLIETRTVDWEIELSADEDGSPYELAAITYHSGYPGSNEECAPGQLAASPDAPAAP